MTDRIKVLFVFVIAAYNAPVLRECLYRRDQACLDAFLRSEPSGTPFMGFLKKDIPFIQVSAAITLARRKHPDALPVLIKALGEKKYPDDVVAVAEALGDYGSQAEGAVASIVRLAESRRERYVEKEFPVEFIRPLLRIGGPEAFEYVGTCADKPIKHEEAEAIRGALGNLSPPSAAASAHLRRWIERQRKLNAPGSYPLVQALIRLEGPGAAKPYLPWIREMAPKGNNWNAWTPALQAAEGK